MNRRFSNGLSYGFAYTLSKCMDDGSNQRDVIPDAYDATFLWGPCDYDTRHVAVINFIYQIPFFRTSSNRALKAVAGGWQVTGVTQFQTGTPFKSPDRRRLRGYRTGQRQPDLSISGSTRTSARIPTIPKQFAAGGNAADPAQYLTVKDSSGNPLFTRSGSRHDGEGPPAQLLLQSGLPELEPGYVQGIRDDGAPQGPVARRGVQLAEPPELGRRRQQPASSTFGKVTGKNSERNLQLSLRYSF